ncbi:MAG: hypothetical protein NXH82_15740 [Rhodobacteraceae bacterium]|nr:hypothetical protein [Paracoccaceae bacterium]
MAFHGDPLPKRAIQAMLRPLGLKVVRTAAYEAIDAVPRRSATSFDKLFCIGFNKTATTTLEEVLRGLGLRMPKQLDQEQFLADVIDRGAYAKLAAFCAEYDAFQDLPFSQGAFYIACDALFPGSKFILTLRDPQAWADSYIRYYKREFGLEDAQHFDETTFRDKTLYLERGYVHRVLRLLLLETGSGQPVTRWDMAFDRDFLIERYLRRNAEVQAYFARRPDDFLALDPGTEPDTGRLLRFLGIEDVAPQPFPRANAG